MPQHFDFSATVEGEWGVLVASGELDLAAEPDLHAHLRALLDGGVRHVVVDRRQVTFKF